MLKRALFSLMIAGLVTAGVSADELTYVGSNGADGEILIDVDPAGDGMIDLSVSMTDAGDGVGGGGLSLINFTGLDASSPANVTLSDFVWTFEGSDNSNNWFTTDLPDPQAASFGPVATIGDGATVELATLAVAITGATVGDTFTLAFGTNNGAVSDGDLLGIPLENSSEIANFRVVPEPATLALLAFGGFAALRRRSA